MTKNHPEDSTLKYPMELDEGNKVTGNIVKIIENHPIVICNPTTKTIEKDTLKIDSPLPLSIPKKMGIEDIMSKLQNLESPAETGKTLKIDLDLYQMERL